MLLTPGNPHIMNDVGAVLQQLRRLEEARDILQESVRVGGGATSENNLGVVMKDLGQTDAALAHFLNAARAEGGGQAVENAANVLRDKGDFLSAYSVLCESMYESETCREGQDLVKIVSSLVLVDGLSSGFVEETFGPDVARVFDRVKRIGGVEKRACGLITFMLWSGLGSVEVESIYEKLSRGDPYDVGEDSGMAPAVHVIVQFWRDSSQDTKTLESVMALRINLGNPRISKVHVLLENEGDVALINGETIGENFGKVKVELLGRRMTFADALDYANRNVPAGEIAVLTNSDIILDADGVGKAASKLGVMGGGLMGGGERKAALALTRWEMKQKGAIALADWRSYDYGGLVGAVGMSFHPRIDSQDTWVVKVPVEAEVVEQSNFFLGMPRCDGRLAAILRSAGYDVSNPSFNGLRTLEIQGVFEGREDGAENGGARKEVGYESANNVVGETEEVLLSIL